MPVTPCRHGRSARQGGTPVTAITPRQGNARRVGHPGPTAAARRRRERDVPVSPFVVARSRPLRGGHRGRYHRHARTASPLPCSATDRSRIAGSYSGHTPPLRGFKHPDDHVPGTGNRSGPRSGSQVRDGRRAAVHVARGRYPSDLAPYVPGSRPGIVSTGPNCTDGSGDFGGQKAKAAPYPRRGSFAVRHRLRRRSPASPCGPLVVQLFAVPGLSGDPRAWSTARSRPSPGRELPTPARVERTGHAGWPGPPGGDFHPFGHHGPAPARERGLSLSPTFLPGRPNLAGLGGPASGAGQTSPAFPDPSNRTPGLPHRVRGRPRGTTGPGGLYSGEPPSNRMSPSRGRVEE